MNNKRRFIVRITSHVMFTNIFLVHGCFVLHVLFFYPFLCVISSLSVWFTAVPLKCIFSMSGFPHFGFSSMHLISLLFQVSLFSILLKITTCTINSLFLCIFAQTKILIVHHFLSISIKLNWHTLKLFGCNNSSLEWIEV